MQIIPYLSFKGECEAAFKFYEQCLGARLGQIFRYGGSPMAGEVPADWSDKIMHGSVTIGDLMLNGGDVAPDRYEEPRGFSLSIQIRARTTPSASFATWLRTARWSCRSRRRSGPRGLAWSSIASAFRG